jgi:hypothetical protein
MRIPVVSSPPGSGDGPKILDSQSRSLSHRDHECGQNMSDFGNSSSRQLSSPPITFGNDNGSQNVIPKNHIPTQLMNDNKGCGPAKAEPENQLLEKILTALRQILGSDQKSNSQVSNPNAASQNGSPLQPENTSPTPALVAPARVEPQAV